ncbi:MAG: Diguanylate phosphodiesterase [Modestobacter sp.]|nr:Diguanylate phosphodiesterase [Modestobacter sp.]MCW2510588.1 Diguanylate phosphodiesterase [Modestobacter sp.]MCW2575854.1 Diguanylate phosphodiesterase [Modestobacter sp.]MCW2619696.1 Diguanylate phosphodiesterase [Modestobacter sp.]
MTGPVDVVHPSWETPQLARRLLLASTLNHVLPSISRIAGAMGLRIGTAPGLLDIVDDEGGRRIDRLLQRLARELTAAETEAVRVTADPPGDGVALATRLLTAPSLAVELARRGVTVEMGLLTEAELWPVYQPIMSLTSGGMVGHEALLRGRVDGREVGGGDLFFLAERAGWLRRLDRLAREAAIAGAAGWLGSADLYVNSNPAAIHRPSVCLATTERAVHDSGIDPRQLVFEVVASHAVTDREHLLSVLEHHRSLGWRVALDDVGVGWSSLALVSVVRPDVVKLSKALVARLHEPGPNAIARALTELTHLQGGVVVAEGVESEQMADQARAVGADLGQGWLFGRPVRPEPESEPELVLA